MIALLGDIHSNLPALEAVLADLPEVREVWILGDSIGEYPFPCQVLNRLQELSAHVPVRCIRGNREALLQEAKDGIHPDWWEGTRLRLWAWTVDRLSPSHWELLSSWDTTLVLDSISGGALLCHGSPRSVSEPLYRLEQAAAALEGISQRLIAFAHIHRSRLFRFGRQILINPGSVGDSLNGVGGVAAYALLDETGDFLPGGVSFRQITYDVELLLETARREGFDILSPGIFRAFERDLRTGLPHMESLLSFCRQYAARSLGLPVEGVSVQNIPVDLWREAELLWDGSPSQY